ncbi:myosin-6 [Anaeramoeba flamelloides]|uniref:Myosin-6 n=1 Tax=Anaeramoeba flamelloides TaxID=1746091 RepID=A0ABQ8Y0S3_9EUKA|nr:myosin-6 [Anaeramoeba flamelloides]
MSTFVNRHRTKRSQEKRYSLKEKLPHYERLIKSQTKPKQKIKRKRNQIQKQQELERSNNFLQHNASRINEKIKTIASYQKEQLSRSQNFVEQFRKIVLFEQITNKFQSLLPHLFLRKDFEKFSEGLPVASCIIFQVLSRIPEPTTHLILVNKLVAYLKILTNETLQKGNESIAFLIANLRFVRSAFEKLNIKDRQYYEDTKILRNLLKELINQIAKNCYLKIHTHFEELFKENNQGLIYNCKKSQIKKIEKKKYKYKNKNKKDFDVKVKYSQLELTQKTEISIQTLLNLFDELDEIICSNCIDDQIRSTIFYQLVRHITCFVMNECFYNNKISITFTTAIRMKKFIRRLVYWFKDPDDRIAVSDILEPIANASNVIIMINEFVEHRSDFEKMCKDICPSLSLVQVWKILSHFSIDEIYFTHISKKILLEYKNLIKNSNLKIRRPKYKINLNPVRKFHKIPIDGWEIVDIPKKISNEKQFDWLSKLLINNGDHLKSGDDDDDDDDDDEY